MRLAICIGAFAALSACTGPSVPRAAPDASAPEAQASKSSIRVSGTAIIGYVKD